MCYRLDSWKVGADFILLQKIWMKLMFLVHVTLNFTVSAMYIKCCFNLLWFCANGIKMCESLIKHFKFVFYVLGLQRLVILLCRVVQTKFGECDTSNQAVNDFSSYVFKHRAFEVSVENWLYVHVRNNRGFVLWCTCYIEGWRM